MKAPENPIKTDDRPLYVQAVEALKTLLSNYRPGEQLPPENQLASQLGISRTTLRMAMGHLEMQGFIERRQGIGTFTANPAPINVLGGLQTLTSVTTLAREAGFETTVSSWQVDLAPASGEWAHTLQVAPGSDLGRVRCTISISGLPVAYLDSLVPVELVQLEELRQNGSQTLFEFLMEHGAYRPAYTHSQVLAVDADPLLAERLQVAHGRALLHLVETFYSAVDRPVALSFNYFVSDRLSFYIGRQIRTP